MQFGEENSCTVRMRLERLEFREYNALRVRKLHGDWRARQGKSRSRYKTGEC